MFRRTFHAGKLSAISCTQVQVLLLTLFMIAFSSAFQNKLLLFLFAFKESAQMELGLTRVDLLQVGLTYPKTAKLIPTGSVSEKLQQKVCTISYADLQKVLPSFQFCR